MRRAIQGDDTILEQWAHPNTSLGWRTMQGDPGFKTDAVTFQEVQRVHPGGVDTPVILEHLGAIVQTDIHEANETLGSLCAIVEAELANEGP